MVAQGDGNGMEGRDRYLRERVGKRGKRRTRRGATGALAMCLLLIFRSHSGPHAYTLSCSHSLTKKLRYPAGEGPGSPLGE
jgi:hypothetical protein